MKHTLVLVWRCLLTLVSMVVLVTAGGSPAVAAADCMSGYGSLFDGYISTAAGPGGTYEGAAAQMTTDETQVCATGSQDPAVNFVYTFVMLIQNYNAPGGHQNGYAQVGYYKGRLQCPYFTTEYDQDNTQTYSRDVKMAYGCLSGGDTHQYWVQYIPSNGHLRMNVDLTVMNETPFTPYSKWYPNVGPFEVQYTAETKYLGTNVPTTPFSGMQVQLYNDSFSNTLPTLYNACTWPVRYTHTGISSNSFSISTSGTSSAYNC